MLAAVTAAVGYALFARSGLAWPPARSLDVRYYEGILVGILVVSAFMAVRCRSRLNTIVSLAAVGYSVGLRFLFFGAPDLAMTQAWWKH
ncbi:MAG: hydrogenase subunit MbhD domain-containing protein [bacterium]